ncbi:hypothetical protein CLOSTMETH_01917 [[Clostridium] methylpentosum DSM 5476]|uniref:Uncharacterized protein n=1 Tax=[Clostridium] methylpentosum DSM 5476 TaxID=537013 RepID=C0EDJ0_9FIRM|nr:hypothetical protein CLOSTMETH_01917 [[Clostridium] methylpentosum DSM 5476]
MIRKDFEQITGSRDPADHPKRQRQNRGNEFVFTAALVFVGPIWCCTKTNANVHE